MNKFPKFSVLSGWHSHWVYIAQEKWLGTQIFKLASLHKSFIRFSKGTFFKECIQWVLP